TIAPVGTAPAFTPNKVTITSTDKDANNDYIKSFGTVKLTAAGTYEWKFTETKGSIDGVTYDETEHTVTIKVVDDGNGNLVADTGSALVQTEAFTNTYAASTASITLAAKKDLMGRDWLTNDAFTFRLEACPNNDGASFVNPASVKKTVRSTDVDHTVKFDEITFTKAGTFYFFITEEGPDKITDGLKYDTAPKAIEVIVDEEDGALKIEKVDAFNKDEKDVDKKDRTPVELDWNAATRTASVTVVNTYGAEKIKRNFQISKELIGRQDWQDFDEFEFKIELVRDDEDFDTDGVDMSAFESVTLKVSKECQTLELPDIWFTKPGKFKFVISEIKPEAGDEKLEYITYDASSKEIVVEVNDRGKGELEIGSITNCGSVTFKNTYEATGRLELKGTKTIEGRKLTNGDVFFFQVVEVDGSGKEIPVATVMNDASGTINYPALEYDLADAGVHTYRVKEVSQSTDSLTVDDTVYEFKVTVTDNYKGEMLVKVESDDGIEIDKDGNIISKLDFVNTYKPAKGSFTPAGTKTLTGRDMTAGEFSFEVKEGNEVVSTGKNVAAKDGVAGDIAFTAISYNEAGDHTYVISEVKPTADHVSQTGTKSYTVKVSVVDDGKGNLVATAAKDAPTVIFTNEYDKEVPHKREIAPDVGIGDLCGVKVGDIITYEISYKNYKSEAATVTIEDQLDEHVEFVNASDNGEHDGKAHGGIVTWTIQNVEAGKSGVVTLKVKVLESALVSQEGPGEVVNGGKTATVQVGNDSKYELEVVTNPVPEQPHKKEVKPYEGTGTLGGVKVGDHITYEISYVNYKATAADVVIKDTLDENVKFVSADKGGVEADGVVTWTIKNVKAGTAGKVTLVVEVLEGALVSKKGPGKVVNGGDTATVKIGNDEEVTLEVVENPVEEEPHKKEVKPYEGTGTLGGVKVGDHITYEISYVNYKATAADVVIKDTLDKNVKFVSADNGGKEADGVVTWTIKNVKAGTAGKVTLVVEVLEGALVSKKGPGEVVNGGPSATVKIGNDEEVTLEVVENPVEEEPHKKEITPYEGTGTLGAVKVGDEIVYEISYVNYKATA
ncbi:MAG: DUF11 domain-containing protein, partial [Clostridia bacterium]|nr:DUF11 domain-containing protein [Clostridia bacterium]